MRSQEVVATSNVFGNNWRLKESCPQSNYNKTEDMCDTYPARKAWAIRQCKIIESDAFKECRDEVILINCLRTYSYGKVLIVVTTDKGHKRGFRLVDFVNNRHGG